MNEISQQGITRLTSGTILDLYATNMLRTDHKLSVISYLLTTVFCLHQLVVKFVILLWLIRSLS